MASPTWNGPSTQCHGRGWPLFCRVLAHQYASFVVVVVVVVDVVGFPSLLGVPVSLIGIGSFVWAWPRCFCLLVAEFLRLGFFFLSRRIVRPDDDFKAALCRPLPCLSV